MRLIPILLLTALATPAHAQLADQLSRGGAPNALDRALSQPPSFDPNAARQADQQRSESAQRDAESALGPVPGSTMNDGPTGIQSTGSAGVTSVPSSPNL